MMDVGRHPRIKLLTLSEVEKVSGYVGNFDVTVRKHARYVNEKDCTACGECANVCPVSKPDEYQAGLGTRKAIHKPFPQAIPSAYLVNMKDCLGTNPLVCGKCQEKCDKKCINLNAQDELIDIKVGAIIVATGLDVYDPTGLDDYGYTKYQNVVTSMEFERILNAGGPTEGHLVRPGDGKLPKKIGFIQCVGSRSLAKGHPYCSNVCCMNTIKDSLLLKEHYPDVEIYVFYIDIRAFGKGFEELYNRSKASGVRYIRGLPDRIREEANGNLLIRVENTTAGKVEEFDLDMVVLSVGLEKRQDGDKLRHLLSLSQTSDGFLLESHPKLMPVDTSTRGVFLAGCAEAPKDIKDTVTQASAAAARAGITLNSPDLRLEAATAHVDVSKCTSCEMCTKVCPYGAITASKATKTPAHVTEARCAGCGSCVSECAFGAITVKHFEDAEYEAQIASALSEKPEDKSIVFACNWCSYAASDLAGLSRIQYPPGARLIRTMCSARVSEKFVMDAFKQGAPVVLVSGCHYADCHYINANRQTVKRVDRLWARMQRLGIRPERLQLEWMSAAEGQKFAETMAFIDKLRASVTPEEIKQTRETLEALDRKKKPAAAAK